MCLTGFLKTTSSQSTDYNADSHCVKFAASYAAEPVDSDMLLAASAIRKRAVVSLKILEKLLHQMKPENSFKLLIITDFINCRQIEK